MDDVSAEKFNRYPPDTRVRPPSERVHRHSRGEKQGHPKNPVAVVRDARLREQHEQQFAAEQIEDGVNGKTPPQEPQGGDIKPDWQAARQHGSEQSPRPQGELKALADRPLTRAQRKELQKVKAEKLFGREPRKV